MAPKQKATSAPKGGKQGKKGSQIEKKCLTALAKDYGIEKGDIQCEIICDKKKEKQLFGIIKIFVSLLIWGARKLTLMKMSVQILLLINYLNRRNPR